VTALVPARVKLGFDRARARDANWLFTNARIPARPKRHVQDQYFEFLEALGVPHEPPRWDLGPWAHERAWQREFLARHERPLAGVVVASSDPSRNWMPERIAALCDALYEREGLQPVLLGGRSPPSWPQRRRSGAWRATPPSPRSARASGRWSRSSTGRRWSSRRTPRGCTSPWRSTGR
jgi:hypothetical protein